MYKGCFSGYDIHQAYRSAFFRPKKSWRKLNIRTKCIFTMVAAELNKLLDKEREKHGR
jgi:hypothetical protein